jgi:hypothetical protein
VFVGTPEARERNTFVRLDNPARLGGLAALLTGVLLVISDLLQLYIRLLDPGAFRSILGVDGVLSVLLAVLMQIGLVGLYAPRARILGILGVVGFVVATVGIRLTMGSSFVFAFIKPIVGPLDPEFFEEPVVSMVRFALTFVLGWVLLGVAMIRTGVYSRAAAALLIVGALILLLPLPLSCVIFAVALVWLGYTLFTGRYEDIETAYR